MKKLELKQLPHRFAPCLSRQGLSHGFLPSLLMLFLMMVLLVTALATPANARRRGKVIFSMDDPMMDDYGPGYYRYPTSKLFSQNPGIYDLRKFTVIDEGSTLLFDLEFKDRIPKVGPSGSSSASGFHLLMVDIYIDKDHIFGSGITRTLAGRNIEFKPESAWDKMILISPLRDSDM
jgi:carbohydrate-binding DOMON domain-containing protein